jgi:hypothetical protein
MRRGHLLSGMSIILISSIIVSCNVNIGKITTSTIISDIIPSVIPHDNFEFHVSYGSCLIDTYNSKTGIYTMDMGPNEEKQTAIFQLSIEEKVKIYSEMSNISIFQYPKEIILPTSTNGMVGRSSSTDHYYLYVIDGSNKNEINWTNDIFDPMSKEGTQFIQLLNDIRKVIEGQPEVRALPSRGIGCV